MRRECLDHLLILGETYLLDLSSLCATWTARGLNLFAACLALPQNPTAPQL